MTLNKKGQVTIQWDVDILCCAIATNGVSFCFRRLFPMKFPLYPSTLAPFRNFIHKLIIKLVVFIILISGHIVHLNAHLFVIAEWNGALIETKIEPHAYSHQNGNLIMQTKLKIL